MAVFPLGPLEAPIYLIAFKDGSYKKLKPIEWEHSQWIHFTLGDGSTIAVNPDNVNYIHSNLTEE